MSASARHHTGHPGQDQAEAEYLDGSHAVAEDESADGDADGREHRTCHGGREDVGLDAQQVETWMPSR